MTKAVVYARISEDRTGAGMGVDRQERECRELAARLGWEVSEVYADNDISAFSGKRRPEYLRLLEDIRSGGVGRVLAWHTDRIHRTPRELEDYIDACETNGAVTHTVKAGLVDLSTAGGRAMARTLCVWARYESDIKRERVKTWARQQAEGGKSHGGRRPFGWLEDRRTKDPREAEEIRNWAVHILAGGSIGEIMKELEERGVPTVSGGRWTRQSIRTSLLSPRLSGWRTHNGILTARGDWEQILPQDVHDQVVAILKDPARRSGNATGGGWGRTNLLSGMVLCDECGKTMEGRMVSQRGRMVKRTYTCHDCGLWRSMEPVNQFVEAYVIARLGDLKERPAVEPLVDESRIQFLREKIAKTKEVFADSDVLTPAELMEILRSLQLELTREQSKVLLATQNARRRTLDQSDVEEFPFYSINRKRAIIEALCEVRLKRVGVGKRIFDPESVVITRR